ncbi:hypothetical protein A3A64_01775 [Candidatus Gottesmanbacteria bacterium RIFCSPLOWO2_01_FULL_48_11]|uniref:Fimbrial assembly family protein n=3 Tax=Candidatus Gottesmaniibacteriota TaxID=1752720 RepID=A0A0G1XPK0_9BACT|nr:MAG: hypothetical protein UY16_C0002G0047 [Candidatus Gottesmanbacteria bacterium GW2011_GWA2_47_9]KKU96260.1 MAG: hypothetical protein UY27_C0002G0045 [Candidatus Gottesmanbacteria bacterium GW2011_GWA1_48_13]OGG27516.1 MAG: hypothetical protein A3A64_01775 [Candidatus Gottesmanbacteria bacterium RIFCSPLOWO2_01_FULL_48_11]
MPANPISVNLLGKDTFSSSPYGRLVTWAITYGRYIMIGTEIVVLLAFISRFSLDRKLTDLKEEISQKQAIIQVNLPFETEIKNLQQQLTHVKTLLKDQAKPLDTFNRLQSYLPPDVHFESYEFSGYKLSVAAVAGTTAGFGQFLASLQADKDITAIDVGDVSRDPLKGIRFKFTAEIAGAKPKEK